jgi:glycosyltransferase involved in cell wall biosynthesis
MNGNNLRRVLASKQPSGTLKVAIVHDWLYGGGAELVVEQLHKIFPEAPIYTSYCSKEWRERLDNKVVTGFLQYWPFSKLRKYVPFLRIWWFTHLKFDRYDLVISSSGAEAKGIRVGAKTRPANLLAALGGHEHRKGTVQDSTVTAERNVQQRDVSKSRRPVHINYCHAPTHYYWSRYDEYLQHPGFGPFDWLARWGLKLLVGPLRKWDYKAAQRPDYIIANSTHIQAEIKKYYGRDSKVIFPPVYFERFQKRHVTDTARRGFLIAGRQTPYKRFDLAISACTRLDLPLTVIGDGPDNARLRRLAGHSVTFLGKVSDEVVEEEFAQAKAFIFPGVDDFGIVPVEALAAGTPVIAYKGGGALDYVHEGQTGFFFDKPTVRSLAMALGKFEKSHLHQPDLKREAARFKSDVFRTNICTFINSVLSR